MNKPRPLALILAATLGAEVSLVLAAQAPAPAPPTFAVGTSAVAIDVVVRDKKGRLVKDLKVEDFEVSEDGRRQLVESFTVVARGVEALPEPATTVATAPAPASAAPEAPSVPTLETPDSPAVLALVFDRMSPGGRDMAHKAALTYLAARQDGDYVGVFSIDLALHTVQTFTADSDRIRTAIDDVAVQAGSSFVSSADRRRDLQTLDMRARDAEQMAMAATAGGSPGNPSTGNAAQALAGGAAVERDIAAMQVGMMQSFEALERDQQGFATSNGLLAVVQGLQRVPGRKTVVFFSEGMAIPDRVLPQFQGVIAAANRANVAIYTFDAGGLRTRSPTEATRDEIETRARIRMQNMGREDTTGDALLKDAERNEDLLRLNPQSGLGMLAEQTGGFLVRDTNDARGSFRQIAQDMRFHYVIGYTPSNENYDGRFRQVSVKVRRAGVNVYSRRGYYAVRGRSTTPVLPYEAPAVAILDQPGAHREAFPFRAVALTFPQPGATQKVPILVKVPGRFPKYAPAAGQQDQMAADLAVVVRVRNEYQQEVSRLSQHYQLTAAAARLEVARSGDILFYREAELPPGRYTLDTIAYDAEAAAASVKSFTLDVPTPEPSGTLLSSLVVIDHVEQVPASERDPGNPLYFGEMLVYPNLGDPVRKAAAKALGFYFTARGPAGGRRGEIEIVRDGKVTARLPLELPAPDETGLLQHAGTLSLASFAPGAYEIRLNMMVGNQRLASRATRFTVAE
jgi:VWFA-related protein